MMLDELLMAIEQAKLGNMMGLLTDGAASGRVAVPHEWLAAAS